VNLASVLLGTRSDAPALTAGESTFGYAELGDAVAQAAGGLAERGMTPGDRVVIVAANTPTFVVAYLATLWVGGIAVPLDPGSGVGELRRRMAAVTPRVAVVDAAGRDNFVAATAEGEGAAPVVVVDGGGIDAAESWEEIAAARPVDTVERADDDIAVLLFTAGTGGPPKAAILTHGNLGANIAQVLEHPGLALRETDVGLGSLPLFHVFGLNVVLGVTLGAGAHLVLVEHFEPTATAALVAARGVTVLAGVPAMFDAWLAVDAPSDSFSTVRLAVSGAAPLSPETARAFFERFGVVLHEGYGLTEASPIVTTAAVSDDAHPGSIGPPLPGVEVQLADVADGTAVLPGDPGEIWVRGPNVFPGYWEAPDATQAVFTPDGWLRTGDIAVADESGWLRIVDRFKDLVIVSGFNVYPAEVETVLLAHPDVAEAAVIGEPDPRTGERLVAFVVPEPGHDPDPTALTAWTARQLARYKLPSRIEIVSELPRSFVGKLLRRELRAPEVP
jgi:long-chain acyl-CoA synthetase